MSDELPDDLPDDVPGARFERGKRHVGLLAGPALAALVADGNVTLSIICGSSVGGPCLYCAP